MALLRYYFSLYTLPIAVSVLLHAVLLGALAFSWQQNAEQQKVVTPKFIEAKLVELKPKAVKAASAPKKPKVVDLAAKLKEQERKKRLAEQKRLQAIKDKQAADKKAADAKKVEDKKRQDQQRERDLAEQKRRERLQQEFQEALLEEEGLLLEEEYATEAQSYADRIRRRIEQNWSRPPSARNGMRCELSIDLVPNGRIVDVNIKTSSGNLAFDRSAVAAVKKVEVFAEVKDIPIDLFERHFRSFSLGFQPEDLRQ